MAVHKRTLFALLPLLALVSTTYAENPKPNILFIVADDLGWNDLGYHNPDIISPNIDSLAKDGIFLNQSYVQPLCSPSRSAFMTGFYPYTMGLQHLVIGERQHVCVPLEKTFLPQVLKQNGYSTHMVGKWHLGFCKWECTPTYRGFDSFYGYYCDREDYYTKVMTDGFDFRFNKTVEREAAGNYSAFQFAERAKTIIQESDGTEPFFIYLPFQSVHSPLQVPQKYEDMYPNIANANRKSFSGMVTALDDAVGDVVQTLKDEGVYNNTIIFFTADNGGWTSFGGNNYPLRGGKFSIFEGGTRVLGFVHSPLLNKKGSIYNGMMHAVDWFPTIVEAAGISYSDPNQDGLSQWKSITSLGASKRNEFIYNLDLEPEHFPWEGRAGIRVGDYKLLQGFPGLYQKWIKPDDDDYGLSAQNLTRIISGPTSFNQTLPQQNLNATIDNYLFNLKDDPEERKNLYDKLPDVVKNLESKMAEYRKKYVPPNYPVLSPMSDPRFYDNVWSPGWC